MSSFSLSHSQLKQLLWSVLVLLVLSLVAGLVVHNWLSAVWLLLGGVIGLGVLMLDQVYLVRFYREQSSDESLITRSPIFLFAFAVLALYILTSSDQFIGFGVIFGVAVGVLIEGWILVGQPDLFLARFTGLLAKPKSAPWNTTQLLRIMILATAYMSGLYLWWLAGR